MKVQVRRASVALLTFALAVSSIVSFVPQQAYSQAGKAPPVKDRVKELESKARQCRTAEEARLLYGLFLADEATTEDERAAAQAQNEYWTQAAKDELVRVGSKWMSTAKADELKAEADKLVEEAIQSLKLDDMEGADKKLKKASNIYPDHLPSVYLLGIGACLNGKYDAGEAQFTKCLVRSPNNVAVLNNTAVCEVKNHKYGEALAHWEKAAKIDPDNPDVKLNVGNFVSAAAKQQIPKVDRPVIDRATSLFSSLTGKGKLDAAFVIRIDNKAANKPPTPIRATTKPATPMRATINLNEGIVISKLSQAKNEALVEESQIVGNGSGFVIAPGYVLTNRHVVSGAQSLSIQPPNGGALLSAKVLAIADTDLALVECKDLQAPPLALATTDPGRGTEVMALGFPLTSMVGKGLKATRGIITGLPEKANNNMMLLDVPVNPGNSGGPLCDQTGRIVGVVTAKTFSDTFTEGYGLAIPIEVVVNFIRSKINGWQPTSGGDTKLEWPAVDTAVSQSTVMILIWKKGK